MGDLVYPRRLPMYRSECASGPRPCPYVSCRHHLAHDMIARHRRFSDDVLADAVLDMEQTCSLDMAESPQPYSAVGDVLGVSRERARQLQVGAEKSFAAAMGVDWAEIEREEHTDRRPKRAANTAKYGRSTRIRVAKYAVRHSAAKASKKYEIPRGTICEWATKYRRGKL